MVCTSRTSHGRQDIVELSQEGQDCTISMYGRYPTWNGRLCAPTMASNGQLVRVAIAYIEARPKRMHERFWQLTYEALVDAWPASDGR